jgi:Golgi phosphoprotein 3 (GPP34)
VHTLGEDLALLAIRPDRGTIAARQRLPYGLRGSELVRLAASGRVEITNGRIVVLDASPAGDVRLDEALASLARARRPPQAKAWVGRPGSGICDVYLARLAAAGSHGGHGGGGGGHH